MPSIADSCKKVRCPKLIGVAWPEQRLLLVMTNTVILRIILPKSKVSINHKKLG